MPDQPQIPEIPDDLTSLSRDQLIALEEQLIERFQTIRDSTDADAVAELTRIADVLPQMGQRVDAIDAEIRAADQARAAVDSYQRRPADVPAVPDTANTTDAPVDTGVDTGVDTAGDGGVDTADAVDTTVDAGVSTAVAASGRRTSVADIAGRQPATRRVPSTGAPESQWYTSLTAGAEIPNMAASSRFQSAQQFRDALVNRTQALTRSNSDQASAMIAQAHLPNLDVITNSDSASSTSAKMLAAVDRWRGQQQERRAITADSGWCAPTETIWDLCDPYVADGMVSLPEIGITRGGIKYFPMPELACFNQYTWEFGPDELECMDKPCLEIPCPTAIEVEPGVIGACLTAGILQARAFPELVDRYVRGLMTAHLMLISKRTLEQMEAGSIPVIYDDSILEGNGFTAALLNAMEFQAIDLREDYLLGEAETLAVDIPLWVRGAIRADLANRLGVDLINITNAYIDQLFTERGLRPTWIKGWQDEAVGAPGAQRAYPTTVRFLIYREGAWVRGLEPIIELESQYDSVLLRQNKFTRLFTEQAIILANMCTKSRVVTVPVCPNGSTAAPVPIVCFSEPPTVDCVDCPTTVQCGPLTTLAVTPTASTLAPGDTQQLAAEATSWPDGTATDVTAVATYTSSDPTVATVSAGGLVTAVAEGTATITVAYTPEGATTPLYAYSGVTVTGEGGDGIVSDPISVSVAVDATQGLTITATVAGVVLDVTALATYTSSDTSVVTVDAAGVVTGVAAGTATITVSYLPVGGVTPLTTTVDVTVTA